MSVRTITKELRVPYPAETVWAFLVAKETWGHWCFDLCILASVDPGWEVGAAMRFGTVWSPRIEAVAPPHTLAFGGHRFDLEPAGEGETLLRWTAPNQPDALAAFDFISDDEKEAMEDLSDSMDLALDELPYALADFRPEREAGTDSQGSGDTVPEDPLGGESFYDVSGIGRSTSREIRVFVSSTFQDLQAERDELSKRTFVELRRLCEERGVAWTDVDLRWGITDEQKAEGEVLPICLEEIDNCRPFFIGILGERYGWVPEEIPRVQAEQVPWLSEARGRSVTELEIIHGVLDDPDPAASAFFYFRDPEYIEGLPPKLRDLHRELPTEEEIQRFGRWTAEERATERKQRLSDLKARIERSGCPVRRFRDPRQLAELVSRDLKAVVDDRFPEGRAPNDRESSALLHESMLQEARRTYVPRPDVASRIDDDLRGGGSALVLIGEPGSGKTALLANWIHGHREESPHVPVLFHFVGAAAGSTAWDKLVGRMMDEMAEIAGQPFKKREHPELLRREFARALHATAARQEFVLVIDGLDELEDRDQALNLAWLPAELPQGVTVILSTLPGRPLEEAQRRGWPTMEVGGLAPEERAELVRRYLARFRKSLSDDHLGRVLGTPAAVNPLFLRTVLEELRLHGDHAKLGEVIDHYAGSPNLQELFDRILIRLERDYEKDRPGLVGEALSLLLASRRGLTEDELLDLLGPGEDRLPRAQWSPFHLAASHLVSNRSGFLALRHQQLKKAVRARYLETDKSGVTSHVRMARYFHRLGQGPRRVEELPWQLAQAKAWPDLAKLLSDLAFLEEAWRQGEHDVFRYWHEIEASSPLRMVDRYRIFIDFPDAIDFLNQEEGARILATMLGAMGHDAEALKVQRALVMYLKLLDDQIRLATAVGNQGRYLMGLGQWSEALMSFRDEEDLARKRNHNTSLASALSGQASVHKAWGQKGIALDLFEKAAEIYKDYDRPDGLQACLGSQAEIHASRGAMDRALELRGEQERIARAHGDLDGVRAAHEGRASIFRTRGELQRALEEYKKAESISRSLLDERALATTLFNQGGILAEMGDASEALSRHKEAEKLAEKYGLPEPG